MKKTTGDLMSTENNKSYAIIFSLTVIVISFFLESDKLESEEFK
jgi:hypothetical protein